MEWAVWPTPLPDRVFVGVEVGDVLDGWPGSWLEVGALCVGDREERRLGHVVGDAEQLGGFAFEAEVQGGVTAAEATAAQGQLEAPNGGDDRSE